MSIDRAPRNGATSLTMHSLVCDTSKYIYTFVIICIYSISVFLISSYGAPLAQRKSFLFDTAQFSLWASGTVNYDYIVTNSIKALLIGSRCIPNGAHTYTNHC